MQGQIIQGCAQGLGRNWKREGLQALVIELVHRIVILAVKIASQQVVSRIPLVLNGTNHAAHGHAHQGQGMAGEHQTALNGFGHHFRRASGQQLFQIVIILRAHDHRHLRRMVARVFQDFQAAGYIQIGDHDGAGARQTCGHQRLQPRGIAKYDAVARRRRLPDAVWIQIKRHILNIFAL